MDLNEKANSELSEVEEEPVSLEKHVERVEENPSLASHSVKYILEAIEYHGTRDVIERGEELERYIFFDDPYGNGEHAVLGHTKELNSFVAEIRRMASEEGENEKILWVEGPTATGKSEFKRCMINGIRGYSKTDGGKRYTLEWNLKPLNSSPGLTYGDGGGEDGEWYRSPININPLSVLPEETRQELIDNLDVDVPVEVDSNIDPFSREAYNYLKNTYREEGTDNLFSQITSDQHLRVSRYTTEVGDGIGVLHSEDTGNPKEKLVGHWMQGAMAEFASRGRKNAQAFSYDGLVGQGNSCLSIIEDARHHTDVLQKLLNVVEENTVKLDNKVTMDIDTLFVVISNPDLEAELNQYSNDPDGDPLRALRRRLDKYEFSYLISPSLEVQLIRRMIGGTDEVWTETGTDAIQKMRNPLEVYGSELAPHTIEAAAIYEVVTRVPTKASDDLGAVEKALAFDRGYHQEDNEVYDLEDLEYSHRADGESGVPVTFTVDVLVELAQEEDVIMPEDVLEKMQKSFQDDTLFDTNEVAMYEDDLIDARKYIREEIEKDVLEAMVGDEKPSEERIEEYVDSVFAWEAGDEDNYKPIKMAEFEKQNFGAKNLNYQDDYEPKANFTTFRKETIIGTINQYLYNNQDEDWDDGIPLSEYPQEIRTLLGENTLSDVERIYSNFSPESWEQPSSGTETAELKEKTINRMVEELGYSEDSAERASVKAIRQLWGV